MMSEICLLFYRHVEKMVQVTLYDPTVVGIELTEKGALKYSTHLRVHDVRKV